ncbi:LuxR family two component transcriptional regulator [Lacibacter cauensis]|uniref:LuxR family two component transcriptional regulator n=1 Tax=Lacibacter cauensis TaxID=510947 RepID=A0A562SDS9_9BACT|nr:response regulator transcription factor [Lacibacter cauensis]TWI79419.1 LuxR family two component transcriptional regulator [Lacibacter cauensis]
MSTTKTKLVIVDDHQIVIDGLRSLLKGYDQYEIVLESTHPSTIVQALQHLQVDILLTDVMMPEMNGLDLAKQVRQHYPSIKIIALSMNGEGSLVNQMIDESDISGYLLKNIGQTEFIAALNKIAAGGIYFSEEVLQEMLKASERKKEDAEVNLTVREIEIIGLIEKEYSNKKIAEELFLSERTVETHRKNIFRKTKTNSVIGLIKYAYEHKLIH